MPAFLDMVKEAILELKERGGSSLAAIKKYTRVNHNLDFSSGSDKANLLKALKHGVTKGVLLQNKGSYKVAKNAAKPKKGPAEKTKKPGKKGRAKKKSSGSNQAAAAAADSANDVCCQHCGITEADDELASFVKCSVRSCTYHKCFRWEGECSGPLGENASNYCSVCEEPDAYFCPSCAAPGRKCYTC
jgi:hypothetical protein